VGDKKSVHRNSVGRPEEKRPLGRPRCRYEDDIKIDLQGGECRVMDWFHLSQNKNSGWIL